MALPVAPNVTFDVYRNKGGPSGTPDLAGGRGHLAPTDRVTTLTKDLYTHVLLVDPTADVRDGFGDLGAGQPDNVYMPDRTGTSFTVYLVQRFGRGTAGDHKRVYLKRNYPTYPTNDL